MDDCEFCEDKEEALDTCKFCGGFIGLDCDGIQEMQVNPFMLEIWDERVEQMLCKGQYYTLCDEI